MVKSRKWKYNERDKGLITSFMDKHLQWIEGEITRCRADWYAEKTAHSLGQLEHWSNMRKAVKFLSTLVQFKQDHQSPEDY